MGICSGKLDWQGNPKKGLYPNACMKKMAAIADHCNGVDDDDPRKAFGEEVVCRGNCYAYGDGWQPLHNDKCGYQHLPGRKEVGVVLNTLRICSGDGQCPGTAGPGRYCSGSRCVEC